MERAERAAKPLNRGHDDPSLRRQGRWRILLGKEKTQIENSGQGKGSLYLEGGSRIKGDSKGKRLAPLAGLGACLLALGLGTQSCQKAPPNGPSREVVTEPPLVQIRQSACGALLRDDFNSSTINQAVWNASSQDPGVRVEIDGGELCLRGTSAPLSKDVLAENPGALYRYAGLYSRAFPQVDAALAVRVKMPSGISSEPGNHVVNVHLCGVHPDCYSEVLFGKVDAKVNEKNLKEYLGWEQRYQDARGWWFNIVNQEPGGYAWRVSGQPLAEQGNERERFYDVLVDYDEPSRLSRGFLKVGEQWVQLGKAESVIRGISVIELKITNVTPLHGAFREARFDDCRLYPNPRRNPIRFVVQEGGQPYRGPRLRVALYTQEGTRKVSEGETDQQGMGYLSVAESSWVAFPVSAMVRISQQGKEIARSIIEAKGVEGLYPSDVWVFDSRQIRRDAGEKGGALGAIFSNLARSNPFPVNLNPNGVNISSPTDWLPKIRVGTSSPVSEGS